MDLKKLAFPDQFLPCCTTTKASSIKKVVSGFGLGLGASLFVLSVVFLNLSSNSSLLNPVLQGFNVYFSRTTGSPCNAGPCNGSIANKMEYFDAMNGTLDGNVSENGGKGEILEASHLGNLSEEAKTENFDLDPNFHVVRESQVHKNVNFTGGLNVSRDAVDQNVSTAEGDLVEVETEQFPVNNNAVPTKDLNGGRDEVLEDSSVGNLTISVDNVGSTGKGKNSSEMNGGRHLPTENNSIGKSSYGFNISANLNGFGGEDCDIFDGRWVRDETMPYYPPGSCPYIDRDFDCHLNKRPDYEYVKWKWKPYKCDIPSLNATDFLERLRGQKLVFVGDSLNGNMWESLICILQQSVPDKKRVYEISGRTEFKKMGFYAFRFEDYNCTVDFVSSPFLVRESSFHGKNGSFETLRLDLMDTTTMMYHDADVLIFNTGHWWTHEKTSRGEDYYQEGNHVHKRLKVLEAYKRGLGTWSRWVDDNLNSNQSQIIFRGYSVTHFRGGPWNSGGQCHKESEPIFNETYLAKYPSKMRALENVLHQTRTPVVYLNISRLTDFRKDGHPSIYRKEYKTAEEQLAGVHAQDCSHWCLPGVPDTWNELLYASLLKAGRGSWRN